MKRRIRALVLCALIALFAEQGAAGYGWPVKPFDRQHAIRGTFGDPRYHLDGEGQLSSFHFGVDIDVADGAPVYAVEPGVVVRRHAASVTVGRASGRRFGYWHVRPVVGSGTHVRLHQLLGYVLPGWGHVHFAESMLGVYRNPLRNGALAPFNDGTSPVVASIGLLAADGSIANTGHLTGSIAIQADIYDLPPLAPASPWDVARLAPAFVWWSLLDNSTGAIVQSATVIDVRFALPANRLYGWIYAPGTYQNKPHRPGRYLFHLAHTLDTARFPDGTYTLEVGAADTRGNIGTATVVMTFSNGPERHG